jgi:DNA-binding SARP family transcriptional activator
MPIWRPLVDEFHTALTQSGVFRTVTLRRLTAAGTLAGSDARDSYGDGRTVTLLITDCMGPQWRSGVAGNRWYRTLRRWCARMPVAVVQPLPERLWRTTALPAETARIGASWPAAPNTSYDVESYTLESAEHGAFPVPFLEASAPWLGNWSRLVAQAGRVPGSIALLGTNPPPSPVDEQGRGDVSRLSPQELLLRFRSLASPEAFRLAGHLAVGRPRLPVMRLVQAAIERNPQPQHLAEVILSGMLMVVPGPPGSYAFRPGVREALLRTLPRSAHHLTTELLFRVGELIDERAGVVPGTLQVAAPGGTDITADGRPIAEVREESVRRLGGTVPDKRLLLDTYRMERELGPGSGVWKAVDTRGGQTVAAYRYEVGPSDRGSFLEQARALAAVRHPNVVGVHFYGFWGGHAWLVTDFVDEGGFRLPYWMLTSVANQVAQCLAVVHGQNLAHGRLTPNCLLLCPDGTVKVTRFALGPRRDTGESKDLDDLGRLLSELLGGPAVPEQREPGDTGLPRARRAFWERFSDAVDDLLSTELDRQRRGRDLCRSRTYDKQSAAASDPYGYHLLGPVRVTHEGRTLPVTIPEEQALLCMLLLRSGRTVTRRELAAGLWGDRLSERRADRDLDRHAARLRNTLGAGILATTPGGYALYATPRTVDLHQCEDLAARAGFRREDGETSTARDLVQYALDLWQGEPLEGVPGPAAEAARVRLRALRLDLCAKRAELDLENGELARAEADLIALMRSHPAREDFRRLHMIALRRQGRVDEALRSYEEYQEHLEHEGLGEPGVLLRTLYRGVTDDRGPSRTAITLEISPAGEASRTFSALAGTLPRLLSLLESNADQYETLGREGAYTIRAETHASATSVVSALGSFMRELQSGFTELADPPTVRVTLWHVFGVDRPAAPPAVRTALERLSETVVVMLSPTLHRELRTHFPHIDASRFRPLHGEEPSSLPLAWYCSVDGF